MLIEGTLISADRNMNVSALEYKLKSGNVFGMLTCILSGFVVKAFRHRYLQHFWAFENRVAAGKLNRNIGCRDFSYDPVKKVNKNWSHNPLPGIWHCAIHSMKS